MLKSNGFKKTLEDSCQAPGRSCQHLIFFPGKKNISTEWEPKNSAALKLLLRFSQQLQKCAKIQMFSTPWWSVKIVNDCLF